MRARRIVTLVTIVALTLGAAACGDDGDDDTDTTTETTEAADTTTTEASTDTTAEEDDVNLASLLRDFLEAEHADLEDLVEGIGSVDLGQGEAQLSLTIGDEPADVDTGIALCEAVLEFGEAEDFDVLEVEVQNDENGGDTELAVGNLDDGCEAA